MRIRNYAKLVGGLALAAVFTVLTSVSVLAQDRVSGVKRLPPNVQFMVRIPDVEQLKARWNKSSMGKLQEDEAFADFRDQLMDKWEELSEAAEAAVGVPLHDVMKVPSGELVLAVTPSAGNKIGGILMMDFGESADVVDRLLEKATSAAEDEGSEVSSESIEGLRVTVIEHPDNANSKVAYAIKDSVLIAASDIGLIESVLVRWSGEDDRSFAGNEVYTYIMQKCATGNDEPVAEWFVDPISLMTTALKSQGEQNFQVQMFMSFLPSLGLNNLRGMGGAIDMATDEFDSINKVMFYVDQPASGVLGLWQFPATKLQPPTWVPDNVSTYVGLNWDVAFAFESTQKLVDMFQGTGALAKILDRMADEPNGPKLHLKDDVIDLLTGQIQLFTVVEDPEVIGSERFCGAFGLKDNGEKMAGVLDRIAQTPGFPGEARQFQGHTIYELSVPAAPGGPARKMGISAVKGQMFVTSHVELMEQVIREDRTPLVQSEDYKRVVAYYPDEVSIIGFQKSDSQVRSAYELLRSGSMNALVQGLDFTGLPPFEALQKYLAPTGSYAVPDERGAVMIQFGLKAE